MAAVPTVRRALRRGIRAHLLTHVYDSNLADTIIFVNAVSAIQHQGLRIVNAIARIQATDDGISVDLVRVPAGSTIAQGTSILKSEIDLGGADNSNQVASIEENSTNKNVIGPGDAVALAVTGSPDTAAGVLSIDMIPA